MEQQSDPIRSAAAAVKVLTGTMLFGCIESHVYHCLARFTVAGVESVPNSHEQLKLCFRIM